MIGANKNESFPITVTLIDEGTGNLASGEEVHYYIRTIDDLELSPPISGILSESSFSPGVYKIGVSIPLPGIYICHAKCSGFLAGTEEIVISEENIYELSKSNYPHNLSVIDVPRTTENGFETDSQIARNVPYGKTDYIISKIKADTDSNWDNPITSGKSYAHYNTIYEALPFKMGGPL